RRIIPLTLADAKIGSMRDRAAHARFWKEEVNDLQRSRNEGLLGENDSRLLVRMSRWALDVSDMLAHIADALHPVGFDQIVENAFAAVKDLLTRRGAPGPPAFASPVESLLPELKSLLRDIRLSREEVVSAYRRCAPPDWEPAPRYADLGELAFRCAASLSR